MGAGNSGPIKHVVIIVKENYAFDCYFGTFPGAEGAAGLDPATDPPPFDPRYDRVTPPLGES